MVTKLINNKLRNKRGLQVIIGVMAIFFFSGCATGFMSSYTYDSKTGEKTKTVYSPLFSTDSLPLAEGAEFRVSVVITRRVEPISYSLLSSIGGLTPDDMESKATAVVHFKNDSQQTYRVALRKIIILNQEFTIKLSEITLNPGDRFYTKSIVVKAPTYNTTFTLRLCYELEGMSFSQNFSMKRETVEELQKSRKQ